MPVVTPGELYKTVPEGKVGRFEIRHRVVKQRDLEFFRLRSAVKGDYAHFRNTPNIYTVLEESNWDVVMSDTADELYWNQPIIQAARGDVLVAGFGLGLVLLEIQDKPEVTSILVVEKNPEVLELVAPYINLNGKVQVVIGDIFDVTNVADRQFNVLWFDIWNNISLDNYDDIKKLRRIYKKYKRGAGSLLFWQEDHVRQMYNLGRFR